MKDPSQSRDADGDRQRKSPLIVGVGASAAALQSLERLLSQLSVGADQAIVLVLQHREALDESRLRGRRQHLDGARLLDVADGMPVEGGAIYLCPANMITTLHGD